MNFWSKNIAYAIGLITTDGNLSKDGRHISLTSTETQLLETFRNCLRIKNKIILNPPGSYSRNKCYKITFGNVKFYKKLLEIGLIPNKTFRLASIAIPEKYLADFLRGHIDGDGSIIRYIDKHNKYKNKTYVYNRLYITFRSASLPHIKWIRRRIKRNLSIQESLSGWKNKKIGTKKPMWSLRFCKKESLILLKYLYYKQNLPCLHRKRNIANSFIYR